MASNHGSARTNAPMIPCKILVVEDDPHISELIKITVSSPLYAITCVDTGSEALAKLMEDKPNLVLLDILMPEPDGGRSTKPSATTPGWRTPGSLFSVLCQSSPKC